MKQWIEDLLALQKLDMRIRNLQTRLEMLPEEKRKLEEEMNNAQSSTKRAKESVGKTEMDIKNVQSEIKQHTDHIQKLQGQSLQVKKNDEYRALMKEVDNYKRKINNLETDEINFYDRLEAAKNELGTCNKNLVARENSIKEEIEELDELKEELIEEIEKTKAKREKAIPQDIDSNVMSIYNRLLGRGKGEPFVPVQGSNCGNCHLKLTPQTINSTRKAESVFCENCSHILYFPED